MMTPGFCRMGGRVVGLCGDGRPRKLALSEVEGSKPSAAREGGRRDSGASLSILTNKESGTFGERPATNGQRPRKQCHFSITSNR
jgi:hypothetical protein